MARRSAVSRVVSGPVERGDQRGRTLGFPTANLSVEGSPLPDGVWAGWFDRASGERFVAAISIGSRPTFYGDAGARLLEAFVLDLDEDLYGEVVSVSPARWLRGQREFASTESLIAQLRRDVRLCRRWYKEVAAAGNGIAATSAHDADVLDTAEPIAGLA